ncbi:hypothetical protein DFH08DRAFT_824177 [Mycena albidolilacea]|uniref:Uncharacterized protein n=1 Tax=Mycena albidolilacea TaxID=1033008 RepID=A0AAD6Z4F2_9AGAR|nr:hypothetical protein DFH08DRAFT_824177 [Mycena albidolilacea]
MSYHDEVFESQPCLDLAFGDQRTSLEEGEIHGWRAARCQTDLVSLECRSNELTSPVHGGDKGRRLVLKVVQGDVVNKEKVDWSGTNFSAEYHDSHWKFTDKNTSLLQKGAVFGEPKRFDANIGKAEAHAAKRAEAVKKRKQRSDAADQPASKRAAITTVDHVPVSSPIFSPPAPGIHDETTDPSDDVDNILHRTQYLEENLGATAIKLSA